MSSAGEFSEFERAQIDRLDAEYQRLSAEVARRVAAGNLSEVAQRRLQDREREIVDALDRVRPGLRPRVATGAPRPWHAAEAGARMSAAGEFKPAMPPLAGATAPAPATAERARLTLERDAKGGGFHATIDGRHLVGVCEVAVVNDDSLGRSATVTLKLRGRCVAIVDAAAGGEVMASK